MKKRILIIKEHSQNSSTCKPLLAAHGYTVQVTTTGSSWENLSPEMIIAECETISTEVTALIHCRDERHLDTPIIIVSASATVEQIVGAVKLGAFDVALAPIDKDTFLAKIQAAMAGTSGNRNGRTFHQRPENNGGTKPVIGTSSAMEQVNQSIELIAGTDITVLISGESGTGKELAAQAIHRHSLTPQAPFIKVNCAAIPRELLESELFGHVKGAFTGATANRQGAFFLADGGTIFLDEIGDMPLELQPKLLHAVEEKQISPVGSGNCREVRVRVIAATNRDLETMAGEGTFRLDLFHRLNGFPLQLPPLRERREDIPLLLDHFSQHFCSQHKRPLPSFSSGLLDRLKAYEWPGNIRELRNLWEQLFIKSGGRQITERMLPPKMIGAGKTPQEYTLAPLDLPSREKRLIVSALQQCGWNQSESARQLGITRNTLRYRMKKYSLSREAVSQ